ncbi:hypothetical protein A9P82_08115 [Arachidicoccus ginsenosidimutans]|uniref:hypothetical protein n=1 Tax=Arachidicoccus sp. BS20 TaxID=1850526 RepID=UPI0007F180DB|nr:hypothetical protein [Arachidicoccus sp. BS20]ANI89258.1 hypothetical protein A9P82_08115 [Arachidicoccus sp. BS20]
MKTLIMLLIMLCAAFSLSAQQTDSLNLANTKWSGTVYAGQDIDASFSFTKDTLSLLDESGEMIEQMTYKLNADTLMLKKIQGGSPCGNEAGVYKIIIKDNKLSFIMIQDECGARKAAFENPYTLVELKKD